MLIVRIADILFLAGGAVAAGLYLTALWASVVLFIRRRSAGPMIAGMIVRLGLLAGLAFGGVQAAPAARELAFAITGFLLARLIVLKSIPASKALRGAGRRGHA
jgi:hypothetical protein